VSRTPGTRGDKNYPCRPSQQQKGQASGGAKRVVVLTTAKQIRGAYVGLRETGNFNQKCGWVTIKSGFFEKILVLLIQQVISRKPSSEAGILYQIRSRV